jgi:DNA-binding transcriptional LysR family regulator
MELRHLRYFVAVAEELSFTRAAERLGIQQPPLSAQIRHLEKELGAPLFRRLARRVELTGAGKLLLEEARGILERVDRTATDVKRRGRGETGRISIGMAGATYFDPAVNAVTREFCKIYPGVFLYSEESSSQNLLARVHAGKLDAAFVWSPVPDRKSLAVVMVAEEDTVLMLPEGHRLAHVSSVHASPVPLAALANEKLMLFARRMNVVMHDAILAACRGAGFEPILGQDYPHLLAIFPAVAAGLGVSIVPQCLMQVHVEGVVFRPLQGSPRVPVNLVHRRDDSSAAVRNLVMLARRVARSRKPVRPAAEPVTA